MKILIVNKFLFPNGGSETYIFNLGKELEEQGHEVQYFGMEHPGRIVGNHAESYTSSMDFHKGKLSKLFYPFKIIYSVEAGKKIGKVLYDFWPDIVHLNNFNFQITPSVIYEIRRWGKKNNRYLPIVYTAHDYQWVCPNHMMYIPDRNEICFRCEGGRFGECTKNKCIHNSRVRSLLGTIEAGLYKKLNTYEKTDLIICPSEFMRKKLATDRALKDKLKVLYNFLEEGGTQTGDEPCEKEDYVLYFGRFAKEKGIETLLEVCRQLPEISFIFAGGGELEKELKDVKNVKNVGFQKGEELKKLIGRAKFSVFPSEWYENCPYSVMESQLYGTPVVASRIGGVPELVEDGITGELFTPGDVDDLKSKIENLWNDKEKQKACSANCRKKKFVSAREYVITLTELYESLGKGETVLPAGYGGKNE